MKFRDLFPQQQLRTTMRATSMVDAFEELLQVVGTIYSAFPADEQTELVDKLVEREELASTVLDEGIAIPHVYHGRFRHLVGAFGRAREGIDFGADVPTVRGIFLLLVPEGRTDLQVVALNKVTSLIQRRNFWRRAMGCKDEEELAELFAEVDGAGGHG